MIIGYLDPWGEGLGSFIPGSRRYGGCRGVELSGCRSQGAEL